VTRFRLILLVSVLVVGCGGGWLTVRLLSPARPNIVLISIDTCRADHVSCYGRFRRITPNIDAVADEGILFSNVITPFPITLPAHSSMLTGTIPPYHGVHGNLNYRLADDNVTLAERLREVGYRTAAVIGSFILDARFGLNQGFDTYDDEMDSDLTTKGGHPERRGEDVTHAAIAWLDEHASEPFFLFVHYYDPHHPYRPPDPYGSIFADDPYAGEIAYTDHCIAQVLDKLKSMGLYDSSLVIITGDHGEGLGDHGEMLHGYFIYHTTTKVPLIVKLPGQNGARRVDDTVSLVDIVPTVLANVGLPVPSELQGKDLSGFFAGNTDVGEGRYLYSESMTATKYGCSSLLGVQTDRWKYIQTTEPELYDLEADPGEEDNLVDKHHEIADGFKERLTQILTKHLRTDIDESKLDLDPEDREKLHALGYVGGTVVEIWDFDTDKEDPKEFLKVFTMIESVHAHLNKKEDDRAKRICEKILEIRPDIAYIHEKLSKIAFDEGDLDDAIHHMSEALKLTPDSADWHNGLGFLLAGADRLDEAAEHFKKALQLALEEAADVSDVDRVLTKRVRANPVVPSAYLNLGSVYLKQGKYAEAVEAYRKSIQANPANAPGNAHVHYLLGEGLAKLGQVDEAIEAYREALRIDPDHAQARRALDAALNKRASSATP